VSVAKCLNLIARPQQRLERCHSHSFTWIKDSTPPVELGAFIYEGLKVSRNRSPPADFGLQILLPEYLSEGAAMLEGNALAKWMRYQQVGFANQNSGFVTMKLVCNHNSHSSLTQAKLCSFLDRIVAQLSINSR